MVNEIIFVMVVVPLIVIGILAIKYVFLDAVKGDTINENLLSREPILRDRAKPEQMTDWQKHLYIHRTGSNLRDNYEIKKDRSHML